MAVINYFDDMLEEATFTEEISGKHLLKDLVKDYIDNKEDDSQLVEIYDCETDTTTFEKVTPESYKVIAIVDGEEQDLETEINGEVVVSILFIPQSKKAWGIIGGIIGVGAVVAGLVLGAGSLAWFAAGGLKAIGAWGLVIGGAALATWGIITATKKDEKTNYENTSDNKSLPNIAGADNQQILGSKYPFIMGKHLINPLIVGSPYHETRTLSYKNAHDGGQDIHVLYTTGYGPQKLTEFKLGETLLAHNKSTDSAPRKTVMHGQLNVCGQKDEEGHLQDTGEISIKYKNNNVKLEILQAGNKVNDIKNAMFAWINLQKDIVYTYSENPKVDDVVVKKDNETIGYISEKKSEISITINGEDFKRYIDGDFNKVSIVDKYGEVFSRTVLEKQVDAKALFVYDKQIYDVQEEAKTVLYYNRSLPSGFRTNSVRFSSSCPTDLEVEIDFPNGLFKTRNEKSGDTFYPRYYNIPLNLAVQWRFVKPGQPASDAESPEGWNTFNEIYFAPGTYEGIDYNEEKIPPELYTDLDRTNELNSNAGISGDTSKEYNQRWINSKVFKLCPAGKVVKTAPFKDLNELARYLSDGLLKKEDRTYYYYAKQQIDDYPYSETVLRSTKKGLVVPTDTGLNAGFRNDAPSSGTVIKAGDNFYPYKETITGLSQSYSDSDFNHNERRYVFRYHFTEEECRKLAGFDTSENMLDVVEVRVIRLTPCYINQTNAENKDKNTAFNYQDMTNWTYLRTKTFDKARYLDALNKAKEDGTLNQIFVEDYIERPQPITEDINRFTYVALQATEDAVGSIGGSISKFSCISESLTPKYNIADKTWYPKQLWSEYKYWQTFDDGTLSKEITQEEYEAHVADDQEHYYKQSCGNDFTTQIRDELFHKENLFRDENGELVISPIVKYTLPPEMELKYISSSTASQFVHAITGSYLTSDAKTYECIEMDKTGEFYEFCEDVTDGTEEIYLGLATNLVSSIDNCNSNRIHKGQDFRDAGYLDYDGDYGTDYAITWANEDETKAVVVTCVTNSRDIIPKERLDQLQIEWENGNLSDTSIIMAEYNGGTCIQRCEYYTQAHHMIVGAYFESYYGKSGYEDITERFDSQGITIVQDEYLKKAYAIFEKLKNIPINALRRNVYKDLISELNIVISKHDDFELNEIYSSYILDVLEQTIQVNQSKKLIKESDGKLHVKFECNGVIVKDIKLENLIQKILVTGRAYIKRSDMNKYEPLIGRPNPYPVTVLNQRNCISKSNTKSFEDAPCGFQVNLIDEDDNYSQNDFYVMKKGEVYTNPSARIEQFQLDYVTNKFQLSSLAKFNLACKIYQVEAYTRTIGILGYAITLGDTVLLQDDTLLVGTDRAGRVVELLKDDFYIYGFTTDEPFDYTGKVEDEKCVQGCLITQPALTGSSRCVTIRCATPDKIYEVNGKEYQMQQGTTNLFLFDTLIAIDPVNGDHSDDAEEIPFDLKINDIVSFGIVGKESIKATVMSIKPNDKGNFTLSLVPYNEGLYNAGDSMPVFHSNMTVPVSDYEYNFNDNITQRNISEEVQKNVGSLTDGLNIGEAPDHFSINAYAQKDGIALQPVIKDKASLNNVITKVDYQILEKQESEEGSIYSEGPSGDKTYFGLKHEFISPDGEYLYLFDRSSDGYPEKKDLEDFRVRAKIVNAYNVISENWEPVIDETSSASKINTVKNSYRTWTPTIDPNGIQYHVTENYIELHDFNNYTKDCYGDEFITKFRVKKTEDDEYGEEITGVYIFDKSEGEFPEKEDLRKYIICAQVINVTSGKESEVYERHLLESEMAGYLTYKMKPKADMVTVSANKDSIEVVNHQSFFDTVYGKDFITECFIKRPDSYYPEETKEEDMWIQFSSKYLFDRDEDGYPEVEDLEKYSLKYRVLNTTTGKYSNEVTLSLSSALRNYGTWKLGSLSAVSDVVDKTAIISLNVAEGNRELYGTIRYGIRIKRIGNPMYNEMLGIEADTEFYTPNYYNTYNSEDDYYLKDTDGNPLIDFYEFLGTKYTQTLPLIGQSNRLYLKTDADGMVSYTCVALDKTIVEEVSSLPPIVSDKTILKYEDKYYYYIEGTWKLLNEFVLVDTTYTYEVYAKTECDSTVTQIVSVTAKPTSIVDLVKSHESYKSLYVEKLSAINANIGLITQGGMGDFSALANYWALSDLSPEDSGTGSGVLQGAFRVGGEDEFIEVKPIEITEDGVKKRTYTITIKAGNIELSSTGTSFNSGTYIYDDKDKNKRLALTSNGLIMQIKPQDASWTDSDKITIVGEITIDGSGNMVITNAGPDNRPKTGIGVTGANVYHFDKNLVDEHGENSEELEFYPGYITPIVDEKSAINEFCFFGKLEKDISNENKRIGVLNTGNYVYFNKDIVTKDGYKNPELEYWNNNASGLGLAGKPFVYL